MTVILPKIQARGTKPEGGGWVMQRLGNSEEVLILCPNCLQYSFTVLYGINKEGILHLSFGCTRHIFKHVKGRGVMTTPCGFESRVSLADWPSNLVKRAGEGYVRTV